MTAKTWAFLIYARNGLKDKERLGKHKGMCVPTSLKLVEATGSRPKRGERLDVT